MGIRPTIRLLRGSETVEVRYDIGTAASAVIVYHSSSPGAPEECLAEWDSVTASEAEAYGHGIIQALTSIVGGFTFHLEDEYGTLEEMMATRD